MNSFSTRPLTLATVGFGLLAAWSCTVVSKSDYTFTDNPGEGGASATGGKGGGSGGKSGTGGKGGTGGTGGSSMAGEAGATATGGTGGATGGSAGKGIGGRALGGRAGGGRGGKAGRGGTAGTGGSMSEAGAGQGGAGPTGDCGNGTVDTGEDCDLGPKTGILTCTYGQKSCTVCTADCTRAAGKVAYCGDGKVQSSQEECDDGNTVNETCRYGDSSCTGCTTDCKSTAAYCGDGKTNGAKPTKITLSYLGLWGGCDANASMPFYLNGVPIPNVPQVSCSCSPTTGTLQITDAAVLAALRPTNNVVELRGVGSSASSAIYTYLTWAQMTVSFDSLPDVSIAYDPYGILGTGDLCTQSTYGQVASAPFALPGLEQCDGGSGCKACESVLPVSCHAIHVADGRAGDGVYRIDPTGGTAEDALSVYCDMTDGGITFEQLAFGRDNGSFAGYTQVAASDLARPQYQQAFIWLYDLQNGAVNIDVGWSSGNCCLADAVDGAVLAFNSNVLIPADAGATGSGYNCSGTYTNPVRLTTADASYSFNVLVPCSANPTYCSSMLLDYFSQNPPASTSSGGAGVALNCFNSYEHPALYMKMYNN